MIQKHRFISLKLVPVHPSLSPPLNVSGSHSERRVTRGLPETVAVKWFIAQWFWRSLSAIYNRPGSLVSRLTTIPALLLKIDCFISLCFLFSIFLKKFCGKNSPVVYYTGCFESILLVFLFETNLLGSCVLSHPGYMFYIITFRTRSGGNTF